MPIAMLLARSKSNTWKNLMLALFFMFAAHLAHVQQRKTKEAKERKC
jgi:hypothetical protein